MDKYEQEIFISPNTKILNSNPENLYRKRLCSIDNVAEIYHENSKILKRNESSFKANLENMIRINNWAYKTFNSTLSEDLKENQNKILDPFEYKDLGKSNFYQKLFEWYSLNAEKIMFTDIFIIMDKTLYQVAGDAKKLILQMSNIDINFLQENIICDCQLEVIQAIVLFVARPWRYMRFIGNRGYRQCLINIGEISNSLKTIYSKSFFVDYFIDNGINQLLDIDGIENTCIRLLVVE
ncbi:TPA: hypothetical protein ACGVEY_002932 [Enterococcus faecium]